jgi:hypothetical protein
VRLDLPARPGQYLALRTELNADRQLLIDVGNPQQLTVADLAVVIAYTDTAGELRQIRRSIPGPVAPGSTARLALDTAGMNTSAPVQVSMESARIVNP